MQILRQKLAKMLAQLPYIPKTLRLVWQASGKWTAVWTALLLLQSLLPVATVYLTRALVNGVVDVSFNDLSSWQQLQPVVWLIGFLAAVMILNELARSAATYVRSVQGELVQDYLSDLIHRQSAAVDLAFYDSADYFDHLHRARSQASYRPTQLLENLGAIVQSGLTLLGLMVVLLPYGLWLPVVLVISGLPAFVAIVRHRLRLHHWRQTATAKERRAWYYDWLLTTPQTAAEVRLFELGTHFRQNYQLLRQQLRQERQALGKSQSVADMQASVIALAMTGLTLIWMLRQLTTTALTLGDIALFYQAFMQGQKQLRGLLENIGELYNNSLFLADLFQFLALEPQIREPENAADAPTPSLEEAIVFDGVSFGYPGSKRPLLHNFNLTIPARQTVAIVGSNGAGKSTLIKLLCRLYDPDAGRILLDGVDLQELSPTAVRRLSTVLFQEPVRYNDTIADNIAYGALNRAIEPSELTQVATAAGIADKIARLPEKEQTMLGNWFANSTNLSGGEWQKLALARAFWRRSPLVILDEPTSAMDPWAEADWLQRFHALTRDKTVVIITHRFTTARYADMIYVMDNGTIVEAGDHALLLAQNGRYAHSWREQMQHHTNLATSITLADRER